MLRYLTFFLLSAALMHSQTAAPPSSFAGCYEVKSLAWSPPADDIGIIPQRVELLNTPRGEGVFRMRAIGVETNRWENFWWWTPEGSNAVKVAWGGGLGGFRGTLKRTNPDNLSGKIKEWCDSRCGWKKRTGHIRLQRIACTGE